MNGSVRPVKGSVRVDRVVTKGTFSLDGETFDAGRKPDGELTDGRILTVAGIEVQVVHNPAHTWGSCSLYAPFLNAVFTGDTLFHGGPGATGRSYSDRPTIEASIRNRLLTLPGDTVVHTGHGQDTTIAAERPNVPTV
ncbi:hypothetical protein ADK57_07200 [Streptomyces sp. MMG1533]|uniref:MBL fold metallo-hydrolase n=1 Tax=Streptomyces sp. MMG1533 TaxID=1415546 RepID=UPI0006AE2897|nr:MBL fold metallo-hydrolase [Streptomyces sp. MMG1533]KOU74319.1 hypothetical protein ADK57_07200 [Streptomyces sp. MMG1533]